MKQYNVVWLKYTDGTFTEEVLIHQISGRKEAYARRDQLTEAMSHQLDGFSSSLVVKEIK